LAGVAVIKKALAIQAAMAKPAQRKIRESKESRIGRFPFAPQTLQTSCRFAGSCRQAIFAATTRSSPSSERHQSTGVRVRSAHACRGSGQIGGGIRR
jgi:hypothetical protein